MNPYEVTSRIQEPPRPYWLSPVAAAIVFGMMIGTFGLYRWLGSNGLALGLYTSVCGWFTLSLTKHPAFRPINKSRMTFIELIVILAICAILHGLMLPGVGSGYHRRFRRAFPTDPASETSTTDAPEYAE